VCRRSSRRVELPLARQPGVDRPGLHDDSFDVMSFICCREAPTGTGPIEEFGKNDRSVYS